MSSFDARKHIRERRLKEAAENLRGKSHFSAPPLVFRPSLPQSVRSSGVDFGDAEKVQNPSEAGDDWHRDETFQSPSTEERSRQKDFFGSLKRTSCETAGSCSFFWRKKTKGSGARASFY